jgi:DNA-directed RNA polymerase subunit H (RpoH/RPB5)
MLFYNKQDIFKKIQYTMIDIFKCRNYTVENTYGHYTQDQKSGYSEILDGYDTENNKCVVYLILAKIGKEKIQKLVTDNENIHLIIISDSAITSKGKQAMIGYNIETFLVQQLIFNILNHKFQPKFTLLQQKDVELLMNTLKCNLNDLPKIKTTDPVSLYYRAKPKQVFRIDRGDGIYYRLVIPN